MFYFSPINFSTKRHHCRNPADFPIISSKTNQKPRNCLTFIFSNSSSHLTLSPNLSLKFQSLYQNHTNPSVKSMEIFNLEKHFAFYGAYHSNPINIMIHMVFVWPILFSGLMLGFYLPMVFFPNQALFTTIVFSISYICMDKKAGSLGALLCFLCWFGASSLALHLGWSMTWKVVLAAQLVCWTAQFLGHGIFEKRAPALLDNLLQAFLMAPFFVLLEALQFSVGYEPYPGFHAKVKILVDANIKEWQEKKKKC